MASKFFFKTCVTIPLAPIIASIIIHLMFYIRCIPIHKLLYFSVFYASFCVTFLSAGIATSISMHVFSLLFSIIIFGLFSLTSLYVGYPLIPQYCHIFMFTYWFGCVCVCVCVCTICLSFRCLVVCILSNVNSSLLYYYYYYYYPTGSLNAKLTEGHTFW
jgi:hypothetical protein